MTTPEKEYDPNILIDEVITKLQLKNDKGIAKALKVEASIIAKVRSKCLPLSGYLLMQFKELTGMSVSDLRNLMGDRRRKFRMNVRHVRVNAG